MTIDDNSSKRSNTLSVIGVISIVSIIVVVIWVLLNRSSNVDELRQITYHVEAAGGYAQIIYTNSNGKNTDPAIYTTPFTKTLTIPIGQQVFLTASNPSQTGDVLCEISVNNEIWKESRATHPVDSVACGGIVK